MTPARIGHSLARRKIYDASARFYAATFPLLWRFGFPRLDRWMMAELHGCARVLDAGTGTGYWARRISEVEPRQNVVGVDFSHEYLVRARRHVHTRAVELVEADVQELPFSDGSFDAVVCCGVLD